MTKQTLNIRSAETILQLHASQFEANSRYALQALIGHAFLKGHPFLLNHLLIRVECSEDELAHILGTYFYVYDVGALKYTGNENKNIEESLSEDDIKEIAEEQFKSLNKQIGLDISFQVINMYISFWNEKSKNVFPTMKSPSDLPVSIKQAVFSRLFLAPKYGMFRELSQAFEYSDQGIPHPLFKKNTFRGTQSKRQMRLVVVLWGQYCQGRFNISRDTFSKTLKDYDKDFGLNDSAFILWEDECRRSFLNLFFMDIAKEIGRDDAKRGMKPKVFDIFSLNVSPPSQNDETTANKIRKLLNFFKLDKTLIQSGKRR